MRNQVISVYPASNGYIFAGRNGVQKLVHTAKCSLSSKGSYSVNRDILKFFIKMEKINIMNFWQRLSTAIL